MSGIPLLAVYGPLFMVEGRILASLAQEVIIPFCVYLFLFLCGVLWGCLMLGFDLWLCGGLLGTVLFSVLAFLHCMCAITNFMIT